MCNKRKNLWILILETVMSWLFVAVSQSSLKETPDIFCTNNLHSVISSITRRLSLTRFIDWLADWLLGSSNNSVYRQQWNTQFARKRVIFTCEIPCYLLCSKSQMVWYFIGFYRIKRILHGRLEMWDFSSPVEKYFTFT